MEDYVLSCRGFQMLYADSYLSHEDFHKMFAHDHYAKMKGIYDPKQVFPTVFEKVCKKAAKIWKQRQQKSSIHGKKHAE